MNIRLILKWYNCWIGLYYDTKNDCIYIFPIPFLGIKIQLLKRSSIYFEGDGVAFGQTGKYYRWIVPFYFNVYGKSSCFAFVEVPVTEWYNGREKRFNVMQNLLFCFMAFFPYTDQIWLSVMYMLAFFLLIGCITVKILLMFCLWMI